MKKFILLTAIIFLTTACASGSLKQLNFKSLETKINNKDSFVLYLTNETDEGKTLKKTLNKVVKDNDIELFYINTEKLNTTDKDNLNNLFTFQDTNIIIFIKDGKEATVLSRINDAYISKTKLEEELKNQGYLK